MICMVLIVDYVASVKRTERMENDNFGGIKNMDMERIVEAARIQSKDQVLCAVDKKIFESDSGRTAQSAEYNQKVVQELKNFRNQVETRKLFPLKDSDWQYAVIVRGIGISLAMEHITTKYSGTSVEDDIDERYEMINSKAELLTVEEYAELHKISHVAAVTRIRRGKIRSAVKVGKEWRIPSLAEPVERGYKRAVYGWNDRLSGLPDRYKVIEEYHRAEFFQDEASLSIYHVKMTGNGREPLEFVCDREKRSRIEQMLIGHPDVICLSDVIMRIDQV